MKTLSGMEWWPMGASRERGKTRDRRPDIGEVVAWEFAAWAVEHVQDAVPNDEEEKFLSAFRPGSQQWNNYAPYRITLRRLYGPKHPHERDRDDGRKALRLFPYLFWWEIYPGGRVPLCSCCGDPAPCRASLAEDAAAEAAADADRAEATAIRGGCQACGEPITSRQRAIQFPEADVRVPFGWTPRFHARQACAGAAARYEEKRQRAIGPVPRVVDTEGQLIPSESLLGGDGP